MDKIIFMKYSNFFKILGYDEVVSFGKAQKNRKINSKHVNDFLTIIKDTKFVADEDGIILVYGIIPIIVNPFTGHILDGQHRLEAFKIAIEKGLIPADAKILVGYWRIEDENHENEVTIMLNSKSKNWSQNDYLDAYAKDIEYYSKLKDFCLSHSLCFNQHGNVTTPNYRYGAAIITGKCCHGWLKDGSFSFTPDQLAVAENIHEEMVQIRQKLGLKNTCDIEPMAVEWHTQRQLMNINDIISLNYIPAGIRDRQIRNKRDWAEVFSILNVNVQKKRLKTATA